MHPISESFTPNPNLVRRIIYVFPNFIEKLLSLRERLFDETKLDYEEAAIIRGLLALGYASLADKSKLADEFAGMRVRRGRRRGALEAERNGRRGICPSDLRGGWSVNAAVKNRSVVLQADLQAAAAIKVRPWCTDHLVMVRHTLAWFGVRKREDRDDLTQEVFFAAYNVLLCGEQIENPRAWLRECARRYASNYRHKELRRSPHIDDGELLLYGKDPEQITSDRERLNQVFAVLTEEEQSIVRDIRGEGVSWRQAAQERGITIEQARYIYACAASRMEELLRKSEGCFKIAGSATPTVELPGSLGPQRRRPRRPRKKSIRTDDGS